MSNKTNATLTGAGTGAATGAMVGSVVPIIGTGIGAAAGGLIGGASGYFSGNALDASEEEANSARDRYLLAMHQYQQGMGRTKDWEQGQQKGISQEQWAATLKGANAAPTGAQATQQLQQGYANAIKGATGAAQTASAFTPAPKAASPLAEAFQRDAAGRMNAVTSPMAHEQALGEVQQHAQFAAAQYRLDSAKLNRQLAEISNVAGVEKAVLASRFAAATGQYPLDMQQASEAGQREAMIGGMLQGALGLGAKAGGAYAMSHQQKSMYQPQSPTYQSTGMSIFPMGNK